MKDLDEQIHNHLNQLQISHNPPPYTHLYNNNHAITDSETFFIKLNPNLKSLQIELETIQNLTWAPKLLNPQITAIDNNYLLITQYIPNQPITTETITRQDTQTAVQQLQTINHLNPNIYSNPRKLSETLNLIKNRLQNPTLTATQHKNLTKLIDTYIKPYIEKYDNSNTLTHTDLKLDNIIKTLNNEIIIIDYESIKPSPIEADLASLYQNLYQTGNAQTYQLFYEAFSNAYPKTNESIFRESVLFKNTLSTTAAIHINPNSLDERIEILLGTIKTKTPPELLPIV